MSAQAMTLSHFSHSEAISRDSTPGGGGASKLDATHNVASEEELIRRTADGDENAMAELVRRGGDLPERATA